MKKDPLHLVGANSYEELVELCEGLEMFHDVFCHNMPYATVSALQMVIGRERLGTCISCQMGKYTLVGQVCWPCRDDSRQ